MGVDNSTVHNYRVSNKYRQIQREREREKHKTTGKNHINADDI